MSNPSDIVSVVSESIPHYSRSDFYKSLSNQCILEEKKVFNILNRVFEEQRRRGVLPDHGKTEYIEYLTKMTIEYNTLAIRFRKIAADSFS